MIFLVPHCELIGVISEGFEVVTAGLYVVLMVVDELQAGNVDRVGHVVIVGRLVVGVDGVVACPPLFAGGCVAAV